MNTAILSQMGTITLMGIMIVFSVLIILWAVIEIMHAIVSRIGSKPAAPAEVKPAQPAPEAVIAAPVATSENDEEIAAVIAAAIAAFTSGENGLSTYNLKIKSFRRISKSQSAWNSDSRGGYEII